MSGVPASTRALVLARDREACVSCGRPSSLGYNLQHRVPRGMGGTSDPAIHSPANLIVLCGSGTTGCHGRVESSRDWGRRLGWLVPHGTDPATAHVWWHGQWVRLTDDGQVQPILRCADSGWPTPHQLNDDSTATCQVCGARHNHGEQHSAW